MLSQRIDGLLEPMTLVKEIGQMTQVNRSIITPEAPGRVAGGDTGDVAVGHYHGLEQDVALTSTRG